MGEVMEEVGGDGFMFSGPVTRRYVAEITDGVVPALQRLGLARTAYDAPAFPRQPFRLLIAMRSPE